MLASHNPSRYFFILLSLTFHPMQMINWLTCATLIIAEVTVTPRGMIFFGCLYLIEDVSGLSMYGLCVCVYSCLYTIVGISFSHPHLRRTRDVYLRYSAKYCDVIPRVKNTCAKDNLEQLKGNSARVSSILLMFTLSSVNKIENVLKSKPDPFYLDARIHIRESGIYLMHYATTKDW